MFDTGPPELCDRSNGFLTRGFRRLRRWIVLHYPARWIWGPTPYERFKGSVIERQRRGPFKRLIGQGPDRHQGSIPIAVEDERHGTVDDNVALFRRLPPWA
jgi:hypothetical protein